MWYDSSNLRKNKHEGKYLRVLALEPPNLLSFVLLKKDINRTVSVYYLLDFWYV